MPMIFNIHTPTHSFALPFRAGENAEALIDRILRKARVADGEQERQDFKRGKGGAGVRYEFEGGRWDLADDDDLEILVSRYNPSTTAQVNLHLTPPPANHVKKTADAQPNPLYQALAPAYHKETNGNGSTPVTAPPPANGASPSHHLSPRDFVAKQARSLRSTVSRRSATTTKHSVHPGTGAIIPVPQLQNGQESLGDKHKRQWKEFHAENGVRTVVGKVGNVDNVRMLLKQGYRHVYVSRPFALKHGLIPKNSGMGTYGYAGLVNLGPLPITVGSKTAMHPVMLSEETNFDCVLGRSWMEKMGIKTDPLDQTAVTYMDTGEHIPCDVVVLKDASGEVITVT
ncbi:hypothetical protein QFC22_003525 [Naganishia vaughanmartiniae]|uniref:Uncharacterized protein n=1 Tax=Naganishia vaughanmartiniae TaxID=1424756 RepID=A0ACC2X4T7_9TREE|nr:hypothetical protein QFC22_003525 [Naganishia vaughanmartiniae]